MCIKPRNSTSHPSYPRQSCRYEDLAPTTCVSPSFDEQLRQCSWYRACQTLLLDGGSIVQSLEEAASAIHTLRNPHIDSPDPRAVWKCYPTGVMQWPSTKAWYTGPFEMVYAPGTLRHPLSSSVYAALSIPMQLHAEGRRELSHSQNGFRSQLKVSLRAAVWAQCSARILCIHRKLLRAC